MPFPLRQRLLGQKGTVSDDTVQSALVLSALMRCNGDVNLFQALFARGLKKWFLSIPPGIGLATIKACLKLLIGISPRRSGVNSAGNGAAMRSAIIGAALSDDPELRVQFVEASARVTHTHPDAIAGAQVIALAASLQTKGQSERILAETQQLTPEWNWRSNESYDNPTGYVIKSVKAAVYCCVDSPDSSVADGIERAIALGGDTDTVAAMVGGILAASPKQELISDEWKNYLGWPQPQEILAIGEDKDFGVSYLRLLIQHLVALQAILGFGFRRLFPPY